MALVRFEPLRNAVTLQDRLNRMFDDVFSKMDTGVNEASAGAWKPAVDIFETEKAIVIETDLPGMTKDNVDVEVDDNVLSIKGERTAAGEGTEDNYYRRERVAGTFSRSFTLPMDVNVENISARFKDGVLILEIPKPEEKKPKKINVTLED
jgi:HSP20 family protein